MAVRMLQSVRIFLEQWLLYEVVIDPNAKRVVQPSVSPHASTFFVVLVFVVLDRRRPTEQPESKGEWPLKPW